MMQTTPTACKIRRILGLSERLMSSKKPLKNTSDSPKKTKNPLKGISKGSKQQANAKERKIPSPPARGVLA
ncbi:hypothetical protein JP0013_03130 [Helicobacter pylori]